MLQIRSSNVSPLRGDVFAGDAMAWVCNDLCIMQGSAVQREISDIG